MAKRRSSVAIGVRPVAPVVVDRSGTRPCGGAVEPVAAVPAVEEALQEALDLRPARRELLVLPEALLGQRERLGRHDLRSRDLDPLLAGPIDGGRPLRHPPSRKPHGPRDLLTGGAFRFPEAGRPPVGRVPMTENVKGVWNYFGFSWIGIIVQFLLSMHGDLLIQRE